MALVLIVLIPTPALKREGRGGAVWEGRTRFFNLERVSKGLEGGG